ncbi:MAG: 23S rRNA (guanosine(2251)-2'-O)-methyltransferase RlmB [Betaproteobacteria bacterium HGW-Betaproteobacteria-11]|nr:MAG: 23S rRNA (guanosine(2251)-2'-O)-methyltransferase RlmB [Betaproteobacteria bacterium HGW-Betaproteobacteria-11]
MAETRLIHGFHAITAKLRHAAEDVREIFVAEGRQDGRMRDLLALAKKVGARVTPVEAARLDALVGAGGAIRQGAHQGVVARVAAQMKHVTVDDVLENLVEPALILVLDGITDPHNLGACLRVADAAGAQAVVAPKDKSCGLNATAIKVASGAADTVPFIAVTNLARSLREMQERGLWVIGAAGEAEKTIHDVEQTVPTAWVLGSEGAGLRRLTRETCDVLARIPMAGHVESLNVSVAAGICLFETRRQRHG